MRVIKASILAGAAALVLAGSAYAAAQNLHRMTVRTPEGGVATIEYSGNVPPKVTFGDVPMAASVFGTPSPFASFDRISAAMNREMGVLLRQADMLDVPFANPLFNATMSAAPPGHAQSWFARAAANDVCMQSVEITQDGNGKPQVVSHTAGDCHGANLTGTADHAIPRDGHGMLHAVGKPPARHTLPMFYEAGYTPH